MTFYAVWDSETGEILKTGNARAGDVTAEAGETIGFVTVDHLTEYIDTRHGENTIVSRPENTTTRTDVDPITADGVDSADFENIPADTNYRVIGPTYSEGSTGGATWSFTTTTVGVYTITFLSFPSQDIDFIVTAE